jgi:hypothetical protein
VLVGLEGLCAVLLFGAVQNDGEKKGNKKNKKEKAAIL